MKIVIRLLLVVAFIILVFASYRSVIGNINFDREAGMRDREVIQRLVDIRTAQMAIRARTGSFAFDLDSLANFVQHGHVASVRSIGELTEEQLEAGMTVARAWAIIYDNTVVNDDGERVFRNVAGERAIRTAGLWDDTNNAPQLIRDTIFTPVMEVHFANRPTFNPAYLPYVPFSDPTLGLSARAARFELRVDTLPTASGPLQVFEARTPFKTYLHDLDNRLLNQKIQGNLDRPGDDDAPRRFPGMQVGSVRVVVNNAGNWE